MLKMSSWVPLNIWDIKASDPGSGCSDRIRIPTFQNTGIPDTMGQESNIVGNLSAQVSNIQTDYMYTQASGIEN